MRNSDGGEVAAAEVVSVAASDCTGIVMTKVGGGEVVVMAEVVAGGCG